MNEVRAIGQIAAMEFRRIVGRNTVMAAVVLLFLVGYAIFWAHAGILSTRG